jgi:hypothetical protein
MDQGGTVQSDLGYNHDLYEKLYRERYGRDMLRFANEGIEPPGWEWYPEEWTGVTKARKTLKTLTNLMHDAELDSDQS